MINTILHFLILSTYKNTCKKGVKDRYKKFITEIKMNCYGKFAHIYDNLINSDIDYSTWAKKIINICEKLNIDRENYLDLACGTGNMTEKLAFYFKNTWAVDLSSEMLSEADIKLRNSGLKVNFICQNIANFNLNKKFNLITCCLDSTNYILKGSELQSYFKSVFNHLENKGVFLFDINSYYKITNILGNNTYTYDDKDITYMWENYLENDIVDMYLTFFIRHEDFYKRFDENHRERAYTCEYIESTLKNCGFKIVNKLDNYSDKIVTDTSERISYVVTKL